MANIPFNQELSFEYGVVDQVTPLIRRVVANNPGAFTLFGTGTYIVGRGSVAVIDPGPDDQGHVDAILAALDGETVSHIVITHTHRDHSPAAAPLRAATGAEIWGCDVHGSGRGLKGETAQEEADSDYRPDVAMADGDLLEGKGWTLEAVYTPGHTSNHTCFHLVEENALFSGDHVMGWSTTIVSPPDGDMYKYMQSLGKLTERSDRIYWPTHGPAIERPQAYVRELIKHREEREEQIMACLGQGVGGIPEMVASMYVEVPEHLHSAAARSVLSHLIHMVETGRVACQGEPEPDSIFSAA
ncbi:MAG: MBL fold metallo-hydrolase [Alphaproteobacteria bacterium]|jgi:glyoxylase-like metal-dependent hydrolase (beta-lactamase superfamily II)|nr:MBL fold metallo-hydrolase [Alphaproteobacteria bacterium]MDP6568030.1 MBL fold metallo-hydrolase [Alphaproteobacteria bacterium]MDP6813497.1 MBL fold metallo-hydrolase [Alphaproteobacteria bacterium]